MRKYILGKQSKESRAMLISDKVDFRANKITGDRERHFVMIKTSFYQVDIAILNVYAPNNSCKLCKVKTGRDERSRQIHNYAGRFLTPQPQR